MFLPACGVFGMDGLHGLPCLFSSPPWNAGVVRHLGHGAIYIPFSFSRFVTRYHSLAGLYLASAFRDNRLLSNA